MSVLGQWISLTHRDTQLQSYFRIQDVEQVSFAKKPKEAEDIYQVIARVRGEPYVYTTKNNAGDAEAATIQLIELIDATINLRKC